MTLATRQKLALNQPLELTVNAGGLLDALGRPLDGGANAVAILSKGGSTVSIAVPLARSSRLAARAVDAVLQEGFRPDGRSGAGG